MKWYRDGRPLFVATPTEAITNYCVKCRSIRHQKSRAMCVKHLLEARIRERNKAGYHPRREGGPGRPTIT